MQHTDRGLTCSDNNLRDLTTAKECSDAETYATSFNVNARYLNDGYLPNEPKGCFIEDSGSMRFNSHPYGARRTNTRSICWQAGNQYFRLHRIYYKCQINGHNIHHTCNFLLTLHFNAEAGQNFSMAFVLEMV